VLVTSEVFNKVLVCSLKAR